MTNTATSGQTIEEFLRDTARVDDSLRVDATLKDSPFETTQRVFERKPDGSEDGPYIRKIFRGSALERKTGGAYEAIHEAQARDKSLPHIPRIYRCEEDADALVVVMECVPGITLRELISQGVPGEKVAEQIIPQICEALTALHTELPETVVHRDVTPSNIICGTGHILDGTVEATLVDFGIARKHRDGNDPDTTHFGTAGYAAPEQYGFSQTDERTDIYGLGMTLAFCLLGRDPTEADRKAEFRSTGITEAMSRVIARACSVDPSDRYQNVVEFRSAFEEALRASSDTNPRALLERMRKWSVPNGVGIVWNLALLAFFVYYIVINSSKATSSSALSGAEPGWYQVTLLVFQAIVLFGIPAVVVWFLADKRRMRKRYKGIDRGSTLRNLPILIGAAAVYFLMALTLSILSAFI